MEILFLQACHFTVVQELQNALNINTHTRQLHKNAVLCHSNTLLIIAHIKYMPCLQKCLNVCILIRQTLTFRQ